MSDFLLDLSANPNARRVIKQLGLPVPMPQALRRAKGPWEERPLADRSVAIGAVDFGGPVAETLAHTLTAAGANPLVVGIDDGELGPWRDAGEAFGRPPMTIADGPAPDDARVHGLLYDATAVATAGDLRGLYDFFHAWIRRLDKCGRIVVLGRPPEEAADSTTAAARGALAGFAKSLAKEVGKKGATSQFVYIQQGAESRLEAVLRWVLSDRSAFVDGQPFVVTSDAPFALNAPRWARPLEGKTALVTGAARGIGAATARTLAEAGARVTVLDLPSDDGPASKTAREIGGEVLLLDITAASAADDIAAHVGKRGLDIVVHNAGVTRDKTIAKMKADYWDLCVDVNLGAVTRVTQALLDAKTLNDGGRVIALSSIAGIAGNVGQTNYAASKSGVIAYVRALPSASRGRARTGRRRPGPRRRTRVRSRSRRRWRASLRR